VGNNIESLSSGGRHGDKSKNISGSSLCFRRLKTNELRDTEFWNVSGRYSTHHIKSGMVQESHCNLTMIWRPNFNWTATDWDLADCFKRNQTEKEMSTAIGMLSVLLHWLQATLQVPRFVYRPTGKRQKYDLKPGAIIGGSWANYSHCNLKLTTIQAIQDILDSLPWRSCIFKAIQVCS
jgi:hypothetical protein